MKISRHDHTSHTPAMRSKHRLRSCLAICFVSVLLLTCSCVASVALYLTFPPPAVDILIMGLDSREGDGRVTRSDSIIVVGINPAKLDVSLLSIPRDIFITMPNYGLQRINAINVFAEMDQAGSGAQVLADSITNSFDIGIDHYIRLDFKAFIAVVDAVGGIDLEVPYTVVDNQFPTQNYGIQTIRFDPGWQHMTGETALIYARTRHQDDDYRRAERQQQVISALSQKLINPLNWLPAWIAIQQHTETDLTFLQIGQLAPTLILNAGDMNQLVINRDYIVAGDGYVTPNYERLADYIQQHFD